MTTILTDKSRAAVQRKIDAAEGKSSFGLDDALAGAGKVGNYLSHEVPGLALDFLPDISGAVGASMLGALGTAASKTAIGAALGGPVVGTIAGLAAGGTIGGMIGKSAQAAARGRSATKGEIMKEGAYQGVMEGLGGIGVRAAGRAARKAPIGSVRQKVFRALSGPDKRITAEILDAEKEMRQVALELKDMFISQGMSHKDAKRLTKSFLMPAEVTGNQIVDAVSALPEGTILSGGGKITRLRELREQLSDAAAKAYVQGLGEFGGSHEVAEKLAARAQRAIREKGEPIGALHEAVERAIGNSTLVKTQGIKASVDAQRQILRGLGSANLDEAGVGTLVKKADNFGETATFSEIKEWRGQVNDFISRLGTRSKDDKARRVGAQLRQAARDAMDDALKKHDAQFGTDLFKEYSAASKAWRDFKQDFDFKVLRKALRAFSEDNETGIKFLRRLTGNQGDLTLSRLKNVLGPDSEEWKTLQAWKLHDIMRRNMQDGHIRGVKLLDDLDNKFGEKSAKILLGEKLHKRVRNFALAVKASQEKKRVANRLGVHILENNVLFGIPPLLIGAAALGGRAGAKTTATALAASGVAIVVPLQVITRGFVTNPGVTDVLVRGMRVPFARRELQKALMSLGAGLGKDAVHAVVPSFYTDEQMREIGQKLGLTVRRKDILAKTTKARPHPTTRSTGQP